jgi:hypothetical protein
MRKNSKAPRKKAAAIRAYSAEGGTGSAIRIGSKISICANSYRSDDSARSESALEPDEKSGHPFFAAIKFMQIASTYLRIPLQTFGIDHCYDFGSIQSKIIVIQGRIGCRRNR